LFSFCFKGVAAGFDILAKNLDSFLCGRSNDGDEVRDDFNMMLCAMSGVSLNERGTAPIGSAAGRMTWINAAVQVGLIRCGNLVQFF
jgi:hypothetical protein